MGREAEAKRMDALCDALAGVLALLDLLARLAPTVGGSTAMIEDDPRVRTARAALRRARGEA